MELRAPEGTAIYLFKEDFLGESYEVAETDEQEEDGEEN
jgi:hypothetical protein